MCHQEEQRLLRGDWTPPSYRELRFEPVEFGPVVVTGRDATPWAGCPWESRDMLAALDHPVSCVKWAGIALGSGSSIHSEQPFLVFIPHLKYPD